MARVTFLGLGPDILYLVLTILFPLDPTAVCVLSRTCKVLHKLSNPIIYNTVILAKGPRISKTKLLPPKAKDPIIVRQDLAKNIKHIGVYHSWYYKDKAFDEEISGVILRAIELKTFKYDLSTCHMEFH